MKLLKRILPSIQLFVVPAFVLVLAGFATAQEKKDAPTGGDAAKNQIEIKDFNFHPATLSVPAGAKIVFVNRDDEPHTVTSTDGKFPKSKPLDSNDEYAVTLTAPGDYAYFCSVHPKMTGKITVTKP